METTTVNTQARALLILSEAANMGVKISVRGDIITATKSFTPGDQGAYCSAESDCYEAINDIRQVKPGSTWGTTSDGVGGFSAIQNGTMRLNKSGCEKRLLKAITAQQAR